LLARGGLEIHAGEADRRVAPDVDAQLVRAGQLRSHRQPQAVTELGRLAPADIAVRRHTLPEWSKLVARRAGLVGYDRVGDVDRLLQFPEDAIGRKRGLVAFEQRQPLAHPFAFGL